jgi:hypothetical protein
MKLFKSVLASLVLASLPSLSAADPSVASTEYLGPFTGENAGIHPENREPHPIAYYGTDLGFSYRHEGLLHFLFGDTWATEAYAPIEASTGSRYDDGFGTVDLAAWSDPSRITSDNIPQIKLEQNPGSNEMSAMNPGHAMDLGKTPMAGFSNGSREFAIFNITKPRGCLVDADCDNGLSCDTGLGYLGTRYFEEESLTLPCKDGLGPCVPDTMTDPAGTAVAGSGFCSDPTSTIWADTPAGHVSAVGLRVRVGLRDNDTPKEFSDIREWLTNKYVNVTATTVENFSPGAESGQPDYKPAAGAGGNQRVFLWGRPGFIGVNATGRTMGLYFAYVDMPFGPGYDWKVNYFTGTDEAGVPQFSLNEKDAVPLDLDSGTQGVQTREVHDIVHQMSVEWLAPLEKWVMFYGGGITRLPSPPLPNCGVLQLFTHLECKDVDVGNGAIRMRTADHPWGPWTPPQDVIIGGDPAVPGSGQYGVGGALRHAECTAEGCAPHSETPFYHEDEYGFFYSANIIAEWTRPAGDGVDVIWNASTWDPYRVVLLRTRIKP